MLTPRDAETWVSFLSFNRSDSFNLAMIPLSFEQAMLSAAMKGELGPLAQAVAKYQLERKLQKELEKSRKTGEKLNTVAVPGNDDKKVNY